MGRLFWKFFLFFFFAQLTTALGVGAFIQFTANDKDGKNKIDQSPISQSLVDAAESSLVLGGVDGLKKLLKRWDSQHLKHRVFVLDTNNQDILNRAVEPELVNVAIKSSKTVLNNTATQVKINEHSYLIFVARSQLDRGYGGFDGNKPPHRERLGPPSMERPHPLMRVITTFPLKALLIGAIASALFAVILAWYFSKPIESLRLAFKQAADGNLSFSAAKAMGSRNDELSDLGRHFDYMAKRLSALLQGQARLLHHVSHELRSPLARMHMALGLAMQSPRKVESSLSRIELEASRMDKLIGELLELSRFESGMVNVTKEKFSLNEVLETIVEDAAFEASNMRVKVVMEIEATIVFDGQLDLIHRAIENVVRNAIKYGPDGSEVNLRCVINKENKCLEISIKDQGNGVLETELEDVFMPFVRGNSGSQVVGHGVGLAITKQVTEAHGGHVIASNLEPIGFCVTLIFPSEVYLISPET